MARTALTRVLSDIKKLDADELRQAQQAIQERLSSSGYSSEEEKVLQALLEAGLVKAIKPRPTGRHVERPLVPIQGKPLSETIIEERR